MDMRGTQANSYDNPSNLDDLRRIVRETEDWPGDASVSITLSQGDRPWESGGIPTLRVSREGLGVEGHH